MSRLVSDDKNLKKSLTIIGRCLLPAAFAFFLKIRRILVEVNSIN
jgi:hypothetical protein